MIQEAVPDALVVVMGVAGSGKSTLGEALAKRLGAPYRDADSFHPPANVEKMHAGIPLTDADREPWLAAIGEWLAANEPRAVATCSALKHHYRDELRSAAPNLRLICLTGPESVAAERVGGRQGHFMPASLVRSQYETLELPTPEEHALTLDFTAPLDDLVADSVAYLEDRS